MRIIQISLNNLGSLSEVNLHFDQYPLNSVGLIGILGATGSGKSTILDAMTLALFGSVARNAKPVEMMSHGAASCFAAVIFEHAGDRYASQWTLHRAGNHAMGNLQPPKMQLSQWNENLEQWKILESGLMPVKGKVEEIIGLDEKRFFKSVLLAQGAFAAFLDSKPADRSELLEKITGTEIYSDLSKAAFEKYKAEKDKLENFSLQLSYLNIWDDAQWVEKQSALQQAEAESHTRQIRLENLQQLLNAAEGKDSLTTQLQSLQKEIAFLEKERKDLTPHMSALANHEKTAHLHAEWQLFNQYRGRLSDLLIQELNLVTSLEQESKCVPELRSWQKALKGELSAKQAYLHSRQPIWLKVNAIDVQIQEKVASEHKLLAAHQAADLGVQTASAEVLQRRQTLADLKQQWQQEQDWLDTHLHWLNLPSVYPAIKQLEKDWTSANQTRSSLDKERAAIDLQLGQSEQRVAEKRARTQQIESALHPLKEQLSNHLERAFPEVSTPGTNLFFQKLANLQKQRNQWQEFSNTLKMYQELQKEQAAWETKREELDARKNKTEQALTAANDRLASATREKEYKVHIYKQQRLIADYAKDRAALREGDPCPLCFSKEHPFRDLHPVEPFIDQAKEESEAAENMLVKAQEHYTTLLVTLQKEQEELGAHQANTATKVRLTETEKQLSQLQKADFIRSLDIKNPVLIENTGIAIQKNLDELTALHSTCAALENSIQRGEQALQVAKEELVALEQTWAVQQNEQAIKSQSCQQATQHYHSLTRELLEAVESFLPVPDVEGIPAALDMLSTRQEEVLAHQAARAEYAQLQEKEAPLLEMAEKLFQTKQQEANVLLSDLEGLRATIQSFKQKRQELMGERSPSDEQNELESGVQQATENLAKADKELTDKLLEMEKNKGILQNTKNQVEVLSRQIKQVETVLDHACQQLGFAGTPALMHLILPPFQHQEYLKQRRELEQKETACQTMWKKQEAQLLEIETNFPELPELAVLRQDLNALSLEQKEALQQIGSLKNQLANQEKQRLSATALRAEMAAQEVELKRWSELNELIGSASGAKFRTIAQGFTLENLLIRANQHLDKLSGRYVILRNPEEELDMYIMDTYLADVTRSMGTLSGGERFQVSLALALGLSEMAGKEVQIQSLFIDEGFGTLDENALDNALTALENLQVGGKMICIISHVRELRERLSVKVQVEKGHNGKSKVHLVER